ncbi:PilZ domain-containing protein [Natroniella sp. ANB-PHB2]|uniref:PilZ domain-containing protein n=1 Tax=Natroniella sp. ANB-PHB2 TaxID=3384444 RepID=UPI0038D47258
MSTKLINNFDLNNFCEKNELFTQELEIKIGNQFYSFLITEVMAARKLKLKFLSNESGLLEKLPLDQRLVLALRFDSGIYHFPITIMNKSKEGSEIICIANLGEQILQIERRCFKRVEIKKEVNYFYASQIKVGLLENLSATGAKLISEQKILTDKIELDLEFASLSFARLSAEIVWHKKRDEFYDYGLKFDFEDINHYRELKDWLY